MNREKVLKRNVWAALAIAFFMANGLATSVAQKFIITAMFWGIFWAFLYYVYGRKALYSKSKNKDNLKSKNV